MTYRQKAIQNLVEQLEDVYGKIEEEIALADVREPVNQESGAWSNWQRGQEKRELKMSLIEGIFRKIDKFILADFENEEEEIVQCEALLKQCASYCFVYGGIKRIVNKIAALIPDTEEAKNIRHL